MNDLQRALPTASYTSTRGLVWFHARVSEDWRSREFPKFSEWDRAVAAVARMVCCAVSPMALLIGRVGRVLVNEAAHKFMTKTTGPVTGQSVLHELSNMVPFGEDAIDRVFSGESLHYEEHKVIVIDKGISKPYCFQIDLTPVSTLEGSVAAALITFSDITSTVEQISRLTDSELRLHVALEGSGMVGRWTLHVASNITIADASVARIYNLPAADCEAGINDTLFISAVHPQDRLSMQAALQEAIRTGRPYRHRYRLVDPDNNIRWVVSSAAAHCDPSGKVTRLYGVVIDVTDQMKVASALAATRFQFDTLTEALPQIVWSADAEGRHDYFSKRWNEFTGIQPEEITENTWKLLVHPDDQTRVAEAWGNALQTGEAYDIDYRFRHHSGEYRWLRVMALPIRDEFGQIVRWSGTSTDVHESYLLAEERERLAQMLHRIATEDQLTEVLTRRAFLEQASAQLIHRLPNTRGSSLLMLDIDHFKQINDRHGHPVGDKVLTAVAHRIRASIRQNDLVGRLGGEEFAVFLPECSRSRALEVAERIRQTVAENPVSFQDKNRISATVSIGVTFFKAMADLDEFLNTADRALYQAKADGRNRIRFLAS